LNVVAYGGGVNSTAMLIGMFERGEKVDLILFADTGGEKPHTYEHIGEFNVWLLEHGFPDIRFVMRVNQDGVVRTLEKDCLDGKMLPSIAYGFKACSMKYKRDPQDKFCNNHDDCKEVWARGEKVVKLIGYDMDEPHRARIPEDEKYTYRYPLIEWNWGREECLEAIDRAGVTAPGKSACFFCPSSKKREVLQLRRVYPALAVRAVAMEKNADLSVIKGLGRAFAWGDLYEADDRQAKMFPETPIDEACECYDGEKT
jgi:hypothetical protein